MAVPVWLLLLLSHPTFFLLDCSWHILRWWVYWLLWALLPSFLFFPFPTPPFFPIYFSSSSFPLLCPRHFHYCVLNEFISSLAILGQLTKTLCIEIFLPKPYSAHQVAKLRPACFCSFLEGLQYHKQERYEGKGFLFRAKGTASHGASQTAGRAWQEKDLRPPA